MCDSTGVNVLRTSDDRFSKLPDFDFAPHYVEVDGMRMHYLDEGPANGATVLLLHGEPSWCYLYRHMIPPLVEAGLHVIAPDLIGFGRSDKPTRIRDYSYANHVKWMHAFVETVDLSDITLFCQDWGSLIGLRVAAEAESRFARIVLANGGLPTGDQQMPKAFRVWRAFARWSPWFPIGRIVNSGLIRKLSPSELAAYDAPFPAARYKAGARAFPPLVPTSTDDPARDANLRAWEVFKRWEKPFLTSFSNRDPITRGGEVIWQQLVPGAADQAHVKIRNAGHFLQDEKGPELAQVIVEFVARTES